jgi:hypothetical protein
MPAYIYEKKILHINRYRRRGDGLPYGTGSKEVGTDRRRKVRDGIILKNFDRRQNNDPYYNGLKRRSGMDRRSGME